MTETVVTKTLTVWSPTRRFMSACLLLLVALIFTTCSGGSTSAAPSPISGTVRSGSSSTPTASTSGLTPTAPLPPGVKPGPQPCPDAVKDPSYGDPIIPTQSGTTFVNSVTCGNLLGNTSLQALVDVYHQGTGQILTTYVYTDITSTGPKRLFKLEQLYKGDARISGNNTVITNEVDGNSILNKGQGNAVVTRDLNREFAWSSSANTFVQVAFPGIFPDLTRYQAETDQLQVNQGHERWKLDAAMTAQALAENFLKWFPNPAAAVQSGGGPQDLNAVVLVRNPDSDGGTVQATLSRLEGNPSGIWEVTGVGGVGVSITSPQSGQLVTSPLPVTGTDSASAQEAIGTVMVFDHLYNLVGFGYAIAGQGTYSNIPIVYSSSFQGGAQEGIVALYAYKRYQGTIIQAVMEKVLLSPTSG